MLVQVQGAGAGWTRSYADDLRYDVFGNRTRAHYGNGDVSTWTFDPARIRLTSLVTTLASSTRVQDLHYTYDPASNPLAIANALPPTPVNNTLPGTSSQTFSYDGVDRLVHATGAGTLSANKTTTFDEVFAYTASHNLAHKTLQHVVINNGGSTSQPAATNYASDYLYGGRPHLPTQVGTMTLAYDPSGNPVTRTRGTSVQNLVWDDDGRMVHVQGMGANQRNVFDAAGLRVFRVGGGDVIFANSFFEFDTKQTGTKHVFAGALKVASVLGGFKSGANPAAPSSQGTAYFFHADHLGSTGVVTTQTGSVNDAHQYFPDGDAWIDAGKGSTVDGFLFSGKPFDPDTGFYDFGQRFYEPKTSLWLGVDSAFVTSPNSAIGNAYMLAPIGFVAQSPARLHDADGRLIIEYGPLLSLGPLPNPPPDPPCGFCGDLQKASDRVASRWITASPLISTVHRTAPSVVMTARLVQVAAACAGTSGVGCGLALALLAADFVPSRDKKPSDASIQAAAAIATGRLPNVPLSSLLATIEDEGVGMATGGGGGLPQLTGNTVPDLARSAVQTLVRSGGTQAQKVALFEQLVPQIQRAGAFVASRSTGTEGSAIFLGRLGEALVISPTGQVFRGSIQSGGVVVGSGGLTPVFDALKLVQ
jgi:RHS repeat-associated protein